MAKLVGKAKARARKARKSTPQTTEMRKHFLKQVARLASTDDNYTARDADPNSEALGGATCDLLLRVYANPDRPSTACSTIRVRFEYAGAYAALKDYYADGWTRSDLAQSLSGMVRKVGADNADKIVSGKHGRAWANAFIAYCATFQSFNMQRMTEMPCCFMDLVFNGKEFCFRLRHAFQDREILDSFEDTRTGYLTDIGPVWDKVAA